MTDGVTRVRVENLASYVPALGDGAAVRCPAAGPSPAYLPCGGLGYRPD